MADLFPKIAGWLMDASLVGYYVVLSMLCVYGIHRYVLVLMYWRVKDRHHQPKAQFEELPRVTIQLPMFNEQYVAERIIEQTCKMIYPRDRLEIQVLDDSTDETQEIAKAAVERMKTEGHDIVYIHRTDRTGFKAGALEAGAQVAKGEFIAIFDADFLPGENMLRDTIHHFTDEKVGMVQSRWEHLNRDSSMLTQTQAILLDGHFVIEHSARNRTGRYMSFNGTGGIWRKCTIADAGGWQHDTLTEDLDLSYRAQMKGWKFIFLPKITSPAELPPEINAFKAQQHRWTKGGAQTCMKLLWKVWRSKATKRVKVEAFFHLTSGIAYILMVLLALLIGPSLLARLQPGYEYPAWLFPIEMAMFFIGTGSALAIYVVSQRELLRSWYDSLKFVPALMAIGIGIAFNNAIAAVEGFMGHQSDFIRTPKVGDQAHKRKTSWRKRLGGFRGRGLWQAWCELLMAIYLTAIFTSYFVKVGFNVSNLIMALPFLLLFVVGYFYVAFNTFYTRWYGARA